MSTVDARQRYFGREHHVKNRLSLWAVIAAVVKPLTTVTYATLPATGLLLDATPWAALPFCEGETLHFKPAPAAAIA